MSSMIRYLLASIIAFTFLHPQEYSLISSTSGGVRFIYRPLLKPTSTIIYDGVSYLNITILNTEVVNHKAMGSPQNIIRKFLFGTTNQNGNQLRIVRFVSQKMSGLLPPNPEFKKQNGFQVLKYEQGSAYRSDTYFPSALAIIESTGSVRNLPVVAVVVNPIRCNPARNEIEIITEIELELTFPSASVKNESIEDEFLGNSILNYSIAKQWISRGNRLIKLTAANSVLASGKWYRFEAPEEGIYKITRDMLSSYGIDAATVDPRTIRIYNNGGAPLSERAMNPAPDDLIENAIYIAGEEDSVFNANDYILFYGRGVNYWYCDTVNRQIVRNYNPYSYQNYYWITSGGTRGKRMQIKSGESANPITTQTSSPAFAFWENDKLNLGKSGRQFVGEEFSSSVKSNTFVTKLEGVLPGKPVNYLYRFINASSSDVPFTIEESGTEMISKYTYGYGDNGYSFGVQDVGAFSYNGAYTDERSSLRFTFKANGAGQYGYLDYFEIRYTRDLKAVTDALIFYSASGGLTEYQLSNFSTSEITMFDISDYANVKLVSNPRVVSGGQYQVRLQESINGQSKYIALLPTKYKTPINMQAAANQNVRGNLAGSKYVIIAPKIFKDQAERLKVYRESQSRVPISSSIFYVEEIFNEFGGGLRDVTAIRNFLRYAWMNWNSKPEYVFILGHGDYDYRAIEGYAFNLVPVYETVESLDETESYNTDDYYANIDGNDPYIDLAIGRMPAQTAAEAKITVDKIVAYEKNTDKSLWRNLVTLVADDGWTSTGFEGVLHTDQSEILSTYYIPPVIDRTKIYLADYPTVATSLGRRKPEVNDAIVKAINSGTLLLNYVGHGSSELWAHEQVFVKDVTVPLLNNSNYFFLTAATCDFGYFDRTNGQCATEALIFKQNSGAIGVFSATRPVYSLQNAAINIDFYTQIFSAVRDTLNLVYPIGHAYYNAKLTRTTSNDLKYHLFADPALRLLIPQFSGNVDSLNGRSLSAVQQIKAMQNIHLTGRVLRPDNSVYNSFSGSAILTVFDSKRQKPLPEFGSTYSMELQGGIIFRGLISIANGSFTADFVVPKDISYENRAGKISLYFYNSTEDGLIFSQNFTVGGSDSTIANDGHGPQIDILFDGDKQASLVRPNSTVVIKLSDETGLNTTGTGIGHKMTGILNRDEANPIDFSNYFTADIDGGGKSGRVEYELDLPPGKYSLDVQAWDVFNNTGSARADFEVTNNSDLSIGNIYNFPNPFASGTSFIIDHNSDEAVNVKVNIYSIAGRLIRKLEISNTQDRNIILPWNGQDDEGNALGNGVYLYKVSVTPASNQNTRIFTGKLAIIR